MRFSCRAAACLLAMALLSIGCESRRRESLQSVARDWCETIRASQVIPVYPLSEDLQPGDVFLVQTPIQRQEELYEKRGFLPLDQMVTRLAGLDYGKFYSPSYFKWYYNSTTDVGMERPKPGTNGEGRRFDAAPLPMAAFPTYNFSVNSRQGIRLALPVQGIPVGLGLMRTNSATGSVTLTDGMTYAIHAEEVLRRLHDWAGKPEVRQTLAGVRRQSRNPVYLRIVTRVYLVGAVTVALTNDESGTGGVDVGQAQQIEFNTQEQSDTAEGIAAETASQPENAEEAQVHARQPLAIIAENLQSATPGGSFRFAYASERAVVMRERFPRLLAVGYLGFDVPVYEDGTLGAPIATRDVLDSEIALRFDDRRGPEFESWQRVALVGMYEALRSIPEEESEAPYASLLMDELDAASVSLIPRRLPVSLYPSYDPTSALRPLTDYPYGELEPDDITFRDLLDYWADLDTSRQNVRKYLDRLRGELETIRESTEEADQAKAAQLRVEIDAFERIHRQLDAALTELHHGLAGIEVLRASLDLWRGQFRR